MMRKTASGGLPLNLIAFTPGGQGIFRSKILVLRVLGTTGAKMPYNKPLKPIG